MTDRELIALFGSESTGRTPEERARSSRRRFVRGQDALAEWSDGARGRVLTAWEALMDHGLDVLREANDSDSAIICDSHDTASLNLKDRRLALGLDLDYVANRARMNSADVRDAEESKRRVPIHRLERIARVLGLDEHRISRRDAGASTAELAVRLRTIGGKSSVLTPRAVLTLAEAHWVGRTQKRLERWLGMEPTPRTFLPRPVYLDRLSALRAGLRLADETRRALGRRPVADEFAASDLRGSAWHSSRASRPAEANRRRYDFVSRRTHTRRQHTGVQRQRVGQAVHLCARDRPHPLGSPDRPPRPAGRPI